jgi:phosphate transport system substrate-binding protein
MRKAVGIFCAIAMSMTMLVGCGSSSSSKSATKAVAATKTTDTEVTGTVSTDGSTSMEKVMGALGEKFQNDHKGTTVTYNPTGSGSGITAVSEGRCEIGLASRKLKDEEKSQGLKETVLANDGISVVVNLDNPVKNLTVDQIAQIYTGQIKNWKDVGGDDAEIVLIGREAGSGTRDGFESITKTEGKCGYRQELTSTGDVITTVSSNPNAIGYASMAAAGKTVKSLSVGGVKPTEKTVKDGTYKIQRPFEFITKDGKNLSKVAQAFFDYATSKDANNVISSAGAVPLK